MADIWMWVIFNLVVVFLLGIDLFLHRNVHVITMKEAMAWSVFWIVLALLFNIYIYFTQGTTVALKFLTGYLIEKSLSIDNLFVFLLIFNYFQTPLHLLHKVLFWGVFGAIVMRGLCIWLGIIMLQKFHWLIYLFGSFLVYTGIKLGVEKENKIDLKGNFILKLFRKFCSITEKYEGARFFKKIEGKYLATPLFVVLLSVEITDLIFAIDSIPAILAITLDPFIVYSSNIFAILGLRSLFFALSGVMDLFYYLHYGLAAVLVLIGFKMLLMDLIHIPISLALGLVLIILSTSIVISLLYPKNSKK
jgi:tellurite resistance protein TerC